MVCVTTCHLTTPPPPSRHGPVPLVWCGVVSSLLAPDPRRKTPPPDDNPDTSITSIDPTAARDAMYLLAIHLVTTARRVPTSCKNMCAPGPCPLFPHPSAHSPTHSPSHPPTHPPTRPRHAPLTGALFYPSHSCGKKQVGPPGSTGHPPPALPSPPPGTPSRPPTRSRTQPPSCMPPSCMPIMPKTKRNVKLYRSSIGFATDRPFCYRAGHLLPGGPFATGRAICYRAGHSAIFATGRAILLFLLPGGSFATGRVICYRAGHFATGRAESCSIE